MDLSSTSFCESRNPSRIGTEAQRAYLGRQTLLWTPPSGLSNPTPAGMQRHSGVFPATVTNLPHLRTL
jgi:hypothetical protein